MKLQKLFWLWVITLFVVMASCQSESKSKASSSRTKQQLNLLHKNDSNLAGIIIYQNDPVNIKGAPPRELFEHPFAIVYYFWDGSRIHDVAYDKNGSIMRDTWVRRFTSISKTEWERVNFGFGSDPSFTRHLDPR